LGKTVDLLTRICSGKRTEVEKKEVTVDREEKTAKNRLLDDTRILHSKKRRGIIEQDC
jgi:hypothetical protein